MSLTIEKVSDDGGDGCYGDLIGRMWLILYPRHRALAGRFGIGYGLGLDLGSLMFLSTFLYVISVGFSRGRKMCRLLDHHIENWDIYYYACVVFG